ncbi:MAG: SRPBCC family protein, partial [Betaproteobacteria bacterium]
MRSVHKSVLVSHSARQMFDLVERIEDYPKFLPWCGGTRILQRSADGTLARIDIDYHGVR